MPLQLVDAGFDVWMGNNRGTKYSAENTQYTDKTSEEYWNWSWGEMGTIDAPAFIDRIIQITSQPQVTYIGYDQGNTQIFYGLTQDKTLASKINKVIALAPCVFYNSKTMP